MKEETRKVCVVHPACGAEAEALCVVCWSLKNGSVGDWRKETLGCRLHLVKS